MYIVLNSFYLFWNSLILVTSSAITLIKFNLVWFLFIKEDGKESFNEQEYMNYSFQWDRDTI